MELVNTLNLTGNVLIPKNGNITMEDETLRELLEVKTKKSEWIKRKIESLNLVEDVDFYFESIPSDIGRSKKTCYLPIRTVIIISVSEKTPKAKEFTKNILDQLIQNESNLRKELSMQNEALKGVKAGDYTTPISNHIKKYSKNKNIWPTKVRRALYRSFNEKFPELGITIGSPDNPVMNQLRKQKQTYSFYTFIQEEIPIESAAVSHCKSLG